MAKRRRKRNSSNKVAFMAVLFVMSVLALVALLYYQGKLPWLNGELHAGITPSPTGSAGPVATPAVTASTTPTSTPEPTPTPEVIDPAKLVITPQNPPTFVKRTDLGGGSIKKTFSDGGAITYNVIQNDKVVNYTPEEPIAFASDEAYSLLEGVTAFRGNNYRSSASFGTRQVTEKKLEIIWTHEVGAISAAGSYWPGAGWTGQPLLIHWDEDVRNMMNIKDEMKSKDLVEVIYPILDGNIYFLDLETGKPTRDKYKIGYSIKGTAMVDPRGYPLLYTGMGLNDNGTQTTAFKYRVINLLDQTEIFSFPGKDSLAYRTWGASDSSALLNRQTDTLIEPMENGMINKIKMNTVFDRTTKTITVNPDITKYRYKSTYASDQGIENSAAYYRNLMFFADNGGTLQCLDINTMEPLWIYNVEDDTDSSIVLEETDEGVFIYTGNQVDKRSKTGQPRANCNIRKFNALTGELIWQRDYSCLYQYYINGGVLGTPIIGKDDIEDLIIYPICFTGTTLDGKLVALDKKTGEPVWERQLSAYSWSSPVDFKSDDGKTYAVFCDYAGDLHLFDPRTGEDLDVISLEGNIEASPAIYDDMLVVGSYAKKIFGVKIK